MTNLLFEFVWKQFVWGSRRWEPPRWGHTQGIYYIMAPLWHHGAIAQRAPQKEKEDILENNESKSWFWGDFKPCSSRPVSSNSVDDPPRRDSSNSVSDPLSQPNLLDHGRIAFSRADMSMFRVQFHRQLTDIVVDAYLCRTLWKSRCTTIEN